ncbi:thiamine biosynthesis protein thio [Rhodanobacter sp. Root561]|uniref:glycine oxidase ThiO n=1 Tax=Rhodanobacter sp. Root561 TaxID=1736560 RepID=UPI0007012805|nr:glycine oxidase ThiO [Rhodanobacter sp. Root561]KQZ79626.1 thiamine biosynthesis protein thio [Rhodanobacter sp. Root561]
MRIGILGAGVAGLVTAMELAERGARVEIIERAPDHAQACAWVAGGMLAPWCERATAEPQVAVLGAPAIAWWQRHFASTVQHGTLVVAASRDAGELALFGRRTERFEPIDAERIGALEPDLAGRFRQGLFFPDEAHLDPRRALPALAAQLAAMGVTIRHGVDADAERFDADQIVDCRGLAARDTLEGLRGVRGEMIVVRSPDLRLSRPVRLLHPRFGLYVVPRGDGVFMLGGTLLESSSRGSVTVRSAMDLLNAAYALHPAFGEAEILELGVGVRPAFADNLPRVFRRGRTVYLNGLYRHGFLLAPALARQATQMILPTLPETDPCISP